MLRRNSRNYLLTAIFLVLIGGSAWVLLGQAPKAEAQKAEPPKAAADTLIIVNKWGNQLAFFDALHRRLGFIDLPTHPHQVLLSADKKTAYVSIYGDGIFGDNVHPAHEVFIIDVATRKITGKIDTSPYLASHGLAWGSDGQLLVACDKSNAVAVVDVAAKKVIAGIDTQSQGSHWIVSLPDGSKAYTSNKFSPFMSVIDTKTRKLVKKILFANGTEGIALSPDGKKLYAMDHHEHIVYVVDTAKDEIIKKKRIEGIPTLPPQQDPQALIAVSLDGKTLFISFYVVNRLAFVDAETLEERKVIPTSKGPMGFAFPRDKNKMYITQHDAGTIAVVDLTKMEIIDTFASSWKAVAGPEVLTFLGYDTPRAPAAKSEPTKSTGQFLFVVNKRGAQAAFFDADHNRLALIDLPPNPHEVSLSPDKKTAYVSIYGDGIFTDNVNPDHRVFAIDLATRKIKDIIDVSPYKGAHGMAWDARGYLWVTCDRSKRVAVIDPAAKKMIGNIDIEARAHWIVALPDGSKAYCSTKDNGWIPVIDLAARKVTKRITFPNGTEGMAVSPDGKRLYVMDHHEHMIYVVDTAKDEIVMRKKIEGVPSTPTHYDPESRVAVSADGKTLLITWYVTDRLLFMDADTLEERKVIQVGKGPMGIAFPKDKTRAYVTNHDAGTISVIDLAKMAVIETFATSWKSISGPETMAFYEEK